MAGDARTVGRRCRFPREPLLQPPIEIPGGTLRTPPIADGDDRAQCEGEAGEKDKASIHGSSLSVWKALPSENRQHLRLLAGVGTCMATWETRSQHPYRRGVQREE